MFKANLIWKRLRSIAIGMMCAATIVVVLSPYATADTWNDKTILTFSSPVEIPGKVLPAGTYVFKLMDSPSDRNIVQIFNQDESHVYATILAVPDYRLQPAGKTVIDFSERPSNSPEALKAWFYPGANYGQQFVYPHERARQLAKQSHSSVLSMRESDMSAPALKKAEVKAVNPAGHEVAKEQAVGSQHPENQTAKQ